LANFYRLFQRGDCLNAGRDLNELRLIDLDVVAGAGSRAMPEDSSLILNRQNDAVDQECWAQEGIAVALAECGEAHTPLR
jgi:hypothetical protein